MVNKDVTVSYSLYCYPKHCQQDRIVCSVTSGTVLLNNVIDLPIIGQVFKKVVRIYIIRFGFVVLENNG